MMKNRLNKFWVQPWAPHPQSLTQRLLLTFWKGQGGGRERELNMLGAEFPFKLSSLGRFVLFQGDHH